MRRALLLCFLLLATPLFIVGDDTRQLERQLKDFYVGKTARVGSLPDPSPPGWEIPRPLARSLDPDVPTYVRMESVKLKNGKLAFQLRELFYYKETDDAASEAEGAAYTLELRFSDSISFEDQVRTTIEGMLILESPNPERLSQLWPPVPESPRAKRWQRPGPEPSQELTPGVFTIGADVTPPKCVDCPSPEFPEQASSRRASGTVGLWALVTEKGRIAGIRVAETTGRSFVAPSVAGVYKWHMEPALRDGKPVRVVMWVDVTFHIF